MDTSRRNFLRASAAATVAAAGRSDAAPVSHGRARSCIVLLLVGGPSQLETFDPKPDAPAEVRGPFRPIATNVTGIRVSEHLPRLASMADRLAIVRTVHHDAPPVHEAGLQLLQTGRLNRAGPGFPHFGAILARQLGPHQPGSAPFVVLPSTLGNMGLNLPHGQDGRSLDSQSEPRIDSRFTHLLSSSDRERYGGTTFGDACARSVQLVEQGGRCVVINMFDTVHDRITWDCHAQRPSLASTLDDYRRTLCPAFDRAFAALLDDLHQRSMLDETLVLAMGEFGRTPRLNANGGRDHWPGCWSIALAGGGVRGGQVIGASDALAAAPACRPVTCAEVVASVYNAMGLPPSTRLALPNRTAGPLVEAAPIRELFS
jgi:uncharacterized protein (DUF1501 family)